MKTETRRVHSIEEALQHIPAPENAGHIIMREVPTEGYFEDNSMMIHQLINQGYQGIYISFQRPFKNVIDHFQKEGIDTNMILFIDAASALSGDAQAEDEHCIPISENINIDELVQAIYQSLSRLTSQNDLSLSIH